MKFLYYQKRQEFTEMRRYVAGEDLSGVNIPDNARAKNSPKTGDMIVRSTYDENSLTLMTKEYFEENYTDMGHILHRSHMCPVLS